MTPEQEQKERVQKHFIAADELLSVYLGPTHPARVELGKLITQATGFTIATSHIKLIMPNSMEARVRDFFAPLTSAMHDASITTPLRAAHFLAQIAQESGELRYTEEIASGEAYEGRKALGNVRVGDGVKFKGRGLIQITGRSNYTLFGQSLGKDLTLDPGQISMLPLSCQSATWYWSTRNLNELADADDVRAITRKINGGYTAIDKRMEYLARGKKAFGIN